MEASGLPPVMNEAVKQDLLSPGVIYPQANMEFTAPIVGNQLPHYYEGA